MAKELVKKLESMGIRAVSMVHTPLMKQVRSDHYGRASTWSERHAAHVSGLGTFTSATGCLPKKGQAVYGADR
jgi:hypothetical protein